MHIPVTTSGDSDLEEVTSVAIVCYLQKGLNIAPCSVQCHLLMDLAADGHASWKE